MEIKTVALLGAGAVGGYFVWGLEKKEDVRFFLIAEGERRERLRTEGLILNGRPFHPEVRTPEEAGSVDLLLVATKAGSLPDALPAIQTVTGPDTIVMSLLNGVDSEEIIGDKIGARHMLYSLMKIASERSGNRIDFDPDSTPGLFYGELSGGAPSERMLEVARLLEGTGIHFHMQEDIRKDIWSKFAHNVSNNLPQAIIACGIGAFSDSEHGRFLVDRLREEVIRVALAKGIDISESASPLMQRGSTLKSSRYSTLQDLMAGRRTEVDLFAGTVMRLGAELGIPTPYNAFAYHTIRMLEEKNEGLFDYPEGT